MMTCFRMLVLWGALALVGGCNVVGAVGYAAAGPGKQEAQFELAKQSTLVLVENYVAPSSVAIDADQFNMMLAGQLARNEVVPVVEPEKLFALREQKGSEFSDMRISDIGQSLGAEQVIYVELLDSRVEQSAGQLVKAQLSARVKVVDARTGRTLWPLDVSEGFPLHYESPMERHDETMSLSQVREKMLQTVARRTARLFYDWTPSDSKEAHDG